MAEIASALWRTGTVYTYDKNGRTIATARGDSLLGYTSSSFTVKRGDTAYVFDTNGRTISSHRL
jgi:tRNA A58 N-methylase Trm61